MNRFASFSQCWSAVAAIPPGTAIKAWSVAGRAKTTFHFLATNPGSVVVRLASGAGRTVSQSDFTKVYTAWPDYTAQRKKRYELGFSQNSVYVLGILHHIGM